MNFVIQSNSPRNFDFAKQYKVWQTSRTFKRIKVGDVAFIKNTGSDIVEFFGIVYKVEQEPVLLWPDGMDKVKTQTQFTIRVRDANISDFNGANQLAIKYGN